MKKLISDLNINSLVDVNGKKYYIIDRDPDKGVALIQSECGKVTSSITFECEVEVIGEVPFERIRGFEPVLPKFAKYFSQEDIDNGEKYYTLPTRKTAGSAGYDFYAPVELKLPPKTITIVMTNVKSYMLQDEELRLSIRSGLSSKGIILMNAPGIVDFDFYSNPDNDGNIGFIMYNIKDTYYVIKAGDRIGQGVFDKYLVADNDLATGVRVGGLGSTGR